MRRLIVFLIIACLFVQRIAAGAQELSGPEIGALVSDSDMEGTNMNSQHWVIHFNAKKTWYGTSSCSPAKGAGSQCGRLDSGEWYIEGVIPDAGHCLEDENPHATNAALLDFLNTPIR